MDFLSNCLEKWSKIFCMRVILEVNFLFNLRVLKENSINDLFFLLSYFCKIKTSCLPTAYEILDPLLYTSVCISVPPHTAIMRSSQSNRPLFYDTTIRADNSSNWQLNGNCILRNALDIRLASPVSKKSIRLDMPRLKNQPLLQRRPISCVEFKFHITLNV